MSKFQEECNRILDDQSILEEDKVDLLEELVKQKYASSSSKQIEKIIMDIMWKHKDPSKASHSNPQVLRVEDRVSQVDIPSLERRLELERQFLELEALREANSKSKQQNKENLTAATLDPIEKEYNELLLKTEALRKDIYGNKPRTVTSNISPIDKISEWFGGAVSRTRVEQALRISGYSVMDAANLIMEQLKARAASSSDSQTQIYTPVMTQPFFSEDKKNKVICSFFVKNGHCLRADCKFSHDIETRTCRFWLKGNCLSGDSCMFKHALDEQLPPSTVNSTLSSSSQTSGTLTSNTTSSYVNSTPTFVPSSSVPFSSKIKISRPLSKPKLVPWEHTAENDFFKRYIHYRDAAFKQEAQRKRYAQMSTEAWKSNNGEKSKKMSDKANKFEDEYFESLKLADEELYNYSLTTSLELWYELHGYEFNDSVDHVMTCLNEVRSQESKNSKTVYLVVPSISQPDYKKTTKPLTIWLDHEGYRYQVFTYGGTQYGSIIALDPWSII